MIGIGRTTAGDDGVGIVTVRALEALEPRPSYLDLYALGDPTDLVDLLQTDEIVVIVDAVLGAAPAGRVLLLDPEDLEGVGRRSSYGVDVVAAIGLARALAPAHTSPCIRIVGITIERAQCGLMQLSPDVEAAVPVAVDRILALADADAVLGKNRACD